MMAGLGVDIVDLRRMRRAVGRRGDRFLHRLFTPGERRYCLSKKDPIPHLAARFAAKEAAKKALTASGLSPVPYRAIEVVRGKQGEPILKLPRTASFQPHLSLSHDGNYAIATVILLCT